jgi:hypothetical protein
MNDLQNRIQGAGISEKIDLKVGFQLIRVKEADEWKMAFCTRYSLYEFTAMPFGCGNAPATFQDAEVQADC